MLVYVLVLSDFIQWTLKGRKHHLDDLQIRDMVTYVVRYLNTYCPENLEAMVHLVGHDERFRKRVEEITEAIIDNHDELFVACSSGKKVEEITPKYAKQCEDLRLKMRNLVNHYLSEDKKIVNSK